MQDVELKHDRVRGLLETTGAEALLLQEPSNIAWFTAGADLQRCASDCPATSLFVTPEARLFATNSVDSIQIFEREVYGLGFQLKQREWFQPHHDLVHDLCRGRKVLSDRGPVGTKHAGRKIQRLRLPLTELEVERLRLLSAVAVHAVEATAGHLKPGITEAEVAGEISHRLLKRTVFPERIQVIADGRGERYRHWAFSEQPIQNYVVLSCCARRWGLHVGVTRTVCFGDVPPELTSAFQKALLVHATGMFFSRGGEAVSDVWKKVQRIYEKFGIGSEWHLADQASLVGFSLNETQIGPQSVGEIPVPSAVFWHPSVGPAMMGDTLLCRDSRVEQLTLSSSWPRICVQVKGRDIPCPGILCHPGSATDVASESAASDSARIERSILNPSDESGPETLESIWELPVPNNAPVWEEDDSPYSHESVLD
ncbi:MAG: M24 family metallopeptidase [Planctomycetaceae bacterium]|nr:M24 family metallopeptidase [Planctomycetaceae bacterium]